jgi:hypothetical protein
LGCWLTGKEALKPFEYQPLETSDTIRLIFINAIVHDSPGLIECNIQHARLNEASYRALSYEWGSPDDDDPTILVDGHTIVVRRNLYNALLSLRSCCNDDSFYRPIPA